MPRRLSRDFWKALSAADDETTANRQNRVITEDELATQMANNRPTVTTPVDAETGGSPDPVVVDASGFVDCLYDVQAPDAQVVLATEITTGVYRVWHTVSEDSVGGLWLPGGMNHKITITSNTGSVTVVAYNNRAGYSASDILKLNQMELTDTGINFTGDVTADGTIS